MLTKIRRGSGKYENMTDKEKEAAADNYSKNNDGFKSVSDLKDAVIKIGTEVNAELRT